MKTSILCICVLLWASCNGRKDNSARNIEVVKTTHQEFFEKWNADYAQQAFATEDYQKMVKAQVAAIKAAFPDYKYTLDTKMAGNNSVFWVRTNTGTHTTDYMGRKASGKPVTWDDAVLMNFNDEGKIVEVPWWTSNFAQKSPESLNLEGTFEYLPPLKGQSIIGNGTFVFLSGTADGKEAMHSEAGSYSVSGEKITVNINYATNPKSVGTSFSWKVKSWAGDTVTFAVLNGKDEEAMVARSVRISN